MIAYPPILDSDWMPYMYVLAYMVFLVAAGSVLAGRPQDGWIFALTGWFLVHGHASFLLFAPAVTAVVLAGVLWPRRRTLRTSVRGFFREQRRNWIPVAAVSALFALPIVAKLAPLLGYPAALAAVRWLSPARLRGFLLAMFAVNVVSSLAFMLYAAAGIDDLTQYYIGYFYWSAPLVTVLVIVVAAFGHPAWVETTGFLDQAERSGVRACLDEPWFTFLMTRQFICPPAQAASGQGYWFYTPGGLPPHAPVLLRFSGIAVVAASP